MLFFLFRGMSGGHRNPVVVPATSKTCLMILNKIKSIWCSNVVGFLLYHLQCLRKLDIKEVTGQRAQSLEWPVDHVLVFLLDLLLEGCIQLKKFLERVVQSTAVKCPI